MRFSSTAVVSEPVNPGGYGAWAAVVLVDGQQLYEGTGYLGKKRGMTNDVAEFSGLIGALTWAIKQNLTGADCDLTVRGDSKLVVMQLSRRWKVKAGAYIPYYYYAERLASAFKHIRFEWIPRENNDVCDCLSKKALTDRGIKLKIQPQNPGSE